MSKTYLSGQFVQGAVLGVEDSSDQGMLQDSQAELSGERGS